MKKVLVVGMGSAGKRHAETAKLMGLDVKTVDPVVKGADYINLDTAIQSEGFDIAVIATPPNLHVTQSYQCLLNNMWVLCEKPLSLTHPDQISMVDKKLTRYANRLMVAYNYRFHRDLRSMNRLQPRVDSIAAEWEIFSTQYRPRKPQWGFLLDSVSHAVDILLATTHLPMKVEYAKYREDENMARWMISGRLGPHTFRIDDASHFVPVKRDVQLRTPHGQIDLFALPDMFFEMWRAFLYYMKVGQHPYPGLHDAMRTQRVLVDIEGLNEES